MQVQPPLISSDQLQGIIFGTVFVFAGLAACCIAAMRRRSGVRAILWLGLWSALYGARPLASSLADVARMPRWFLAIVPYVDTISAYFVLVVASLAFLELTAGKIRSFLKVVILAGLVIGVAGIGLFVFTGSKNKLILYNQILATCLLLVLVTVLLLPRLSRKYFVLPNRGVLAAGTLFFTVEALCVNVARPLSYKLPQIWDDLGFAALLFSLGYVAMQRVYANERRLLSIENELAIAHQIQASILPSTSPELAHLSIAAAYRPMTAVAGDFYDFIPVDRNRVGILVADVSGHGVPAALVAGMIKMALQSIVPCAHDPQEVMRGLNRVLSAQLHDQFVTASYLWLDTENRKARYSAAGHPPLLRLRGDKLERIESNGLLFGVMAEPDYPVCEMTIDPGDRFLLYTDGVTEPENASGDSFDDYKLEQVVRNNKSRPQSELVDQLLSEIRQWQPSSMVQQDDITLIVVDVV
ncbi:MAG TPA: PP2C family protein-serine/threonine phosphatase [Terracidiphilus sp.]|nr:PP2C family protein-serine/threonine phosphatase [Terracidiphilus sp.]